MDLVVHLWGKKAEVWEQTAWSEDLLGCMVRTLVGVHLGEVACLLGDKRKDRHHWVTPLISIAAEASAESTNLEVSFWLHLTVNSPKVVWLLFCGKPIPATVQWDSPGGSVFVCAMPNPKIWSFETQLYAWHKTQEYYAPRQTDGSDTDKVKIEFLQKPGTQKRRLFVLLRGFYE